MFGFFSKDGAIHNLQEQLVAKVISVEFPAILDSFFTSVAVSRVLIKGWGWRGGKEIDYKMDENGK